jgi:predicted ATP-grasp superfamily ATP-dependent carboligase
MSGPGVGTRAILLGADTQIGLALVRELAAAGVQVTAISHRAHAIGLASRGAAQTLVVGPPRSPTWLAALNRLAQQGEASLITVSEANLNWLQQHRGQLDACLKLSLPPAEALTWVLDKSRTLTAAQQLGMAVPRTEQARDWAEVEALAACFAFPAVLKWADPNQIAPLLAQQGLDLVKVEYVFSGLEWLQAAERYRALGQWPLLQQYCRGRGVGHFMFLHGDRVLQRFAHLRVAEWPPEGGFSSVCDAQAWDARVGAQSEALLRRIGWQGVAMVEYRLDETSGQAWLMEVNGRFWGSYPLAQQCDAGFGWLTHAAALGLPLQPPPMPRARWRCRMVGNELKGLLRVSLQPARILDRGYRRRPLRDLLRFVGDFLRPGVGYYVWSWRDPMPWFRDLGNLLLRRH